MIIMAITMINLIKTLSMIIIIVMRFISLINNQPQLYAQSYPF